MKNICFIGNYKKTFFFDAIAQEIRKHGVTVFWIVMNQKQYDFLVPLYGASNVLMLNKNTGSIPSEKIGEYKINELVAVDRALKWYGSWGYDFLRNIQKPVYNYIKANNINFIFGETTYGHELVIHRMLADKTELNCTYLHPQTIRIPGYHFTFLKDEFQSEIYENFKHDAYNEGFVVKLAKPTEFARVEVRVKKSLSVKSKLNRVVRFFTSENVDKDDPSIVPTTTSAKFAWAATEEWNRVSHNFVTTQGYDAIEGRKFVVYTLHKQPEASIDVVGRYYDDQFKNIQNIWRILPDDWYLVVKEHTNAIGDRSFTFFKNVSSLRNVVLLHPTINSHDLIRDCQAIFSVSGSIAYEAALFGKPAFLFVPIFFDKLRNCHRITLDTFRRIKNIDDLLKEWEEGRSSKMPVEEFSRYLLVHSSKGLISDPLTDPKCMEKENIDFVTKAFVKLAGS